MASGSKNIKMDRLIEDHTPKETIMARENGKALMEIAMTAIGLTEFTRVQASRSIKTGLSL